MSVWKIGLMQGRILPDDIHLLQFFPSKWQDEMQLFKAVGFDFMEILADKALSDFNPLYSDEGWSGFGRLSRELRLPAPMLCADYFTEFPFTGETAAASRAILLEILGKMDSLGVGGIVLPFFAKGEVSSPVELEEVLRGLGEGLKFAADHSIRLLVECTLCAGDTCDALDRLNGDNDGPFALCLDLGNAMSRGFDPVDEIAAAGKRIGHVHIKDCRFNTPGNRLLGEGDVDFPACFRALERIGYTGLLSLETAMGEDPLETAKRHLGMVNNWLKK
ncbi:sugar phosphate isomerase/epimerase family protein [uncultured Pseudodesulfovibrio sp.]|uniref:sugar phosphate isomerase/epimerase family protein n=1 Tax=uncultured Pseudodesulfovibrio sp. TaxID=2035858 RepID=UPI0029C92AF4|nr:sugar phosphate isomerase/epimerase family protein [uncultured Pseudodesulfovibrio sp.]